MAVSVVDIQVNSQGAVRGLREVDSTSQKLDSTVIGVNSRLRDASGRFTAAGSSATQASSQIEKLAGSFQTLKNIALNTLATLGVSASFAKIISDSVELEKNIRRLGTVGVDVKEINSALTQLGERLGNVVNKADLAAASYQAASAGFSDTAGNVQILEAATKAAVGGLADTQAVTEVLVKTLNAYGMSGSQAAKVTDSISKAVELGNQEWGDYTSQLGRVVSIAALAGVSIDEVNAFIAAATKNGATAEIAFTGLSAGLNTLLQPTKESSDAAKSLGIEWNLSGLQAKGFTGLLAELAKKQDTNKEAVARLLGSQEAMRGVFAANAKAGADFRDILLELGNASGKTDADFQTMAGSLDNQIKRLETAMKIFSESAYNAFGPPFTNIVSSAADSIIAYTKEIDKTKFAIDLLMASPLGKFFSDVAVQIGIATSKLQDFYLFALKSQPVIGPVISAMGIRDNFIKSQGFTGRGLPPSANVPSQYPEGIMGGARRNAAPTGLSNAYDPNAAKANNAATRAAENAAKAAAKESERVAQVIRDRLAEGQLLQVKSRLQDKISAAEISGDKMLAARLQGLQKEIDIQYQYAQELAKEKNIGAQEAIIYEGNTKLVANQRDTQRELAAIQRQNEQDGLQAITAYLEKQYELNTAIQQQHALAESISSTLGQGMTAVFDSLIQGSDNWGKSLQQIASKVLVDIANQLIRIYVIEQAVSAIKSFLTPFNPAAPLGAGGGMVGKFGTFGPNYGIAQRALGGPVASGSTYLVGERGPELFTPSRGGSIIPNNALGGGSTSIVVNVDASGSSVQGDQAQGRQLGVAISAAVQAELVKQQRPGGILAGTR